MAWDAIFVAFFVSHQVGDFLLQTEWQAVHKAHGLGRDSTARRALLGHSFTYGVAFIPSLLWLSQSLGWDAALISLVVVVPHMVQDDRRLITTYVRRAKGMDPAKERTVMLLVDQAFHFVALLGAAVLAHVLA